MAKGKSKELVQKTVGNQLTEEKKVKTEQEAKDKDDAKAKAEQEAKDKDDAKAKAEQEAKDKADAEAKAKANQKDYSEKAKKIMKEQNAKEIWRCTETGYWFTRKDYADEQLKKTGKSLEHYKQ